DGNALSMNVGAGSGVVTNNGIISLNSTGAGTFLTVAGNGGGLTFQGAGRLLMGDNANNSVNSWANVPLINAAGHTIEGSGSIGFLWQLQNAGVITATNSTPLLLQNFGSNLNTGSVNAATGGMLVVYGDWNNTCGQIVA